jgi:hypothetical protein
LLNSVFESGKRLEKINLETELIYTHETN